MKIKTKHTDKTEEKWTTENTDNDKICIRIYKKNSRIYKKGQTKDNRKNKQTIKEIQTN